MNNNKIYNYNNKCKTVHIIKIRVLKIFKFKMKFLMKITMNKYKNKQNKNHK